MINEAWIVCIVMLLCFSIFCLFVCLYVMFIVASCYYEELRHKKHQEKKAIIKAVFNYSHES